MRREIVEKISSMCQGSCSSRIVSSWNSSKSQDEIKLSWHTVTMLIKNLSTANTEGSRRAGWALGEDAWDPRSNREAVHQYTARGKTVNTPAEDRELAWWERHLLLSLKIEDQSPGPTAQKERSNSPELSSDLHACCVSPHPNTHDK